MNARPSLTSAQNFLAREGRWRETVHDAVRQLDQLADKIGIAFYPCEAETFAAIRYEDRIPGPLNPRYDHCKAHLTKRNFVGIVGLDRSGRAVSTQAIRLYHWYAGANLASEARAMRVIYDDADRAGHTEYSLFSQPIAERIHGRVTYNGAVFVADAYRGERPELGRVRLSQVVSALSRLLAAHLFDADWCIATCKADHIRCGIADRYGWAKVEPGVTQHIESIGGDTSCGLMWSRRADILHEAEAIARSGLCAPEPEPLVVPAIG